MRLALHSSWQRRREMMVMLFHVIAIPVCLAAFFFCCAAIPLWPLIGLYLLFMALDPRAEWGTPLSPWQEYCRSAWWWKDFAHYFPIRLHKTVDLKPCFAVNPSEQPPSAWQQLPTSLKSIASWWWKGPVWWGLWWYYLLTFRKKKLANPTGQRYIFGYHPHGIIGMGAVGGVTTDGAGWSKLFPGIPVRLLTLASNFYFPFHRDYLLAVGACSVSKKSCLRQLENNNPICIVLGGARESLLAEPNKFELILDCRKGFVKIALQTGASMVPILAFGETNIYEQELDDEGILKRAHTFMTKHLGFTIPLFHARGVFNYDKGLLPYRKPIDIVVGAPVDVPLIAKPSNEDVEKYHSIYVEQVRRLFDQHKAEFWDGEELKIVG